MKLYVVGSCKNKYLPLDSIREKFFVDVKHEGDNIDYKNPYYCEITALYYLWKNCTDDIVGLEHYRRYFINKSGPLLSENDINMILSNHDIIMYKYTGTNAYNDMSHTGKLFDLNAILYTVKEFYGDDMYDFFKAKCKASYVYEGNMFVAKKVLIDEYCQWLFEMLSIYDAFFEMKAIQRKPRIDGYLAEYMFGPWMEYHNKKIYNCQRQTYSRDLHTKLYGHV